MRAQTCGREERILLAARGGRLDGAEHEHLGACPECAAAVAADAAMRAAAGKWSTAAGLPGAAQLLLRARLEARRRAAERSLRPILIWQRVTGAAAVIAAAAGLALWGPIFPALAANPAAGAVHASHVVVGCGLAALATLLFTRRRDERS
jgi:anti-sigma factor RsiW